MKGKTYLRIALAALLAFSMFGATSTALASPPSQTPAPTNCATFGAVGVLPEAGVQQREQDVFPTRTTGVAHFYNFTGKEYTLRIADKWQSLHVGSRFYPYETWIELLPGEYEYAAYFDGGVIYGSTRVIQTLTWPAAIGEPYQEPEPPKPVGLYAPPSARLSTLVIRNASKFELTVTVLGQSYNMHAVSGEIAPEVIVFSAPGTINIQVHFDPNQRAQAERAGCGSDYDAAVRAGVLLTKDM
ncbi:MAG: hypothetical protein AAB342_06910, partial [Chloroflexota bacterium]